MTSGLLDQLSDASALPSLSLVEVNASAALQTRRDRKYVVAPEVVITAIRGLPSTGGLGVLEVAGRFEQRYRSVYFDTEDGLLYRMAATGRRRRFKVRRRIYEDGGTHVLEVKTKDPKGRTAKARLELGPSDDSERAHLSVVEQDFVTAALREAGVRQCPPLHALRTSVQTAYVRTTLAAPGAGWRATVDRQLFGGPAGQPLRMLGQCVIVETKSDGAPTPLDRVLWARGVRPQRVSKFAVATALSEPGLPANRWNRVLRDHLDWHR